MFVPDFAISRGAYQRTDRSAIGLLHGRRGSPRRLTQGRAQFSGPSAGRRHQKTEIGLGRDKAHALADQLDLASDVAHAAEPGELAVRLGRGDGAVDRREDLRIVEPAGLAE